MDALTNSRSGTAALKNAPKRNLRKPIPAKILNVLWARAAGRCQYDGCNTLLIGDMISGAGNANRTYIAHIIADSPDGPRGDPILSPKHAHDPDNLMLMCDTHHRVIDREMVAEHPMHVLQDMKRRHEERVRIVTGIDQDRGSHVIRFAAKIGTNESPVATDDLKRAMLPETYPIDGGWIDLDLITLALPDHDPLYWQTHIQNLRTGFVEKVRGRMERGEIRRLTVFGLAPIPLLIELGRQISDISTAEVRQLLRAPKGWKWDAKPSPVSFSIGKPTTRSNVVALKLEISANIADERIAAVLGPNVSNWSIAADGAHNDIMRRPEDLAEFAKLFRKTLDDIKIAHGENTVIHLFPAIPVSAAVEAGRSWQPKAHPTIKIYDQNRTLGGFNAVHELAHAN